MELLYSALAIALETLIRLAELLIPLFDAFLCQAEVHSLLILPLCVIKESANTILTLLAVLGLAELGAPSLDTRVRLTPMRHWSTIELLLAACVVIELGHAFTRLTEVILPAQVVLDTAPSVALLAPVRLTEHLAPLGVTFLAQAEILWWQ